MPVPILYGPMLFPYRGSLNNFESVSRMSIVVQIIPQFAAQKNGKPKREPVCDRTDIRIAAQLKINVPVCGPENLECKDAKYIKKKE